jgi:hypothetical protein
MDVHRILNNPYIMAVVKLSLALYAARIAPRLPESFSLFDNTFVKIALIALMVYLANIDFQLAIMIAIIYVLGVNKISGRGFLESYEELNTHENEMSFEMDIKKLTDLLGKPVPPAFGTIIESHSDNYPGCEKVTMSELLAIFDGDASKLQNALQYSYHQLITQLPKDSASKDRLVRMAHAAGLPLNVPFDDANAPLIATYLINVGFMITESCRVPQ